MIFTTYSIQTPFGVLSTYQVVSKITYDYINRVLEYEYCLYKDSEVYNQNGISLLVTRYFINNVEFSNIQDAITNDLHSKYSQ